MTVPGHSLTRARCLHEDTAGSVSLACDHRITRVTQTAASPGTQVANSRPWDAASFYFFLYRGLKWPTGLGQLPYH